MDSILASALGHIGKIEARIKQQLALIERLKKAGSDPSEAARTLNILQTALEEVRIQIAQLVPSTRPTKRGPQIAIQRPPAKKK